MDIIATTNTIQTTSEFFSNNTLAYIICISLIFLASFIFMCYQLLNIFRNLLEKVIEDVLYEVRDIKQEIRVFKQEIREDLRRQ